MCGRFSLIQSLEPLLVRLGMPPEAERECGDPVPRYNIAPSQPVWVLYETEEGRNLARMVWGWVPSWAKGDFRPLINARAETAATKPMFRAAFRRRRCAIPADGFYEWRRIPGTRRKQPYRIQLQSAEIFAFAGLYEVRDTPQGTLATCAILTCPPNALMAAIHPRMPVILDPDEIPTWIDPRGNDHDALQELLRPYPTERMEAYPIGTRINRPSHDDPEVLVRSDATMGPTQMELDPDEMES